MPFDCFMEDEKRPVIDATKEELEIARLKRMHGFKATVEWDDEKKVVVAGKSLTSSSYHKWKSLDSFMTAMFNTHGIYGVTGHPKWKAKTFSEVFGYPPRHMHDHMNRLMYKKFVVPYKDILVKVNFQRGHVAVNSLQDIQRNEAVCREVYEDGLFNLLPVVALTGASPKELKQEWGGAWKVISKNSLNKNRAVASLMPRMNHNKYGKDFLLSIAQLPTSVLHLGGDIQVMRHVAAHYKGQWGKLKGQRQGFGTSQSKALRDIHHVVTDTERLASQLEAPFDPLWSPRKMKEKHDQYSRELTARKYSPAKIEWLKDIAVKEVSYAGYNAVLLDSRALIAEEGNAMGHCVAGYAESVAGGSYLVYSITKDGERSSTLGVHVREKASIRVSAIGTPSLVHYIFSQHYGKYNARLTDEKEAMLGRGIVDALNGNTPKFLES